MATFLLTQGHVDEAIEHFYRAIDIRPAWMSLTTTCGKRWAKGGT
jgi:hypothetical protein